MSARRREKQRKGNSPSWWRRLSRKSKSPEELTEAEFGKLLLLRMITSRVMLRRQNVDSYCCPPERFDDTCSAQILCICTCFLAQNWDEDESISFSCWSFGAKSLTVLRFITLLRSLWFALFGCKCFVLLGELRFGRHGPKSGQDCRWGCYYRPNCRFILLLWLECNQICWNQRWPSIWLLSMVDNSYLFPFFLTWEIISGYCWLSSLPMPL